jgi:LPXTG-motif cell wall-anchored protein
MRNRLTIATVALLMLVPAAAFAQEAGEVDCYVNPNDPACSEVLDEEEEVTEEEVTEEEVAEEEIDQVSVEVLETAETDDAALAETGVSATLFSVIAALMLAAGALLLVVSRRRDSTV